MNRELRVEDLLRTHPGVSDVAVIRDHHSSISAFVVPNDAYIDDVLGRRSAALSVINKWRKVYDLTQLAKDASSAPVGFNTLGWNSSYTRKPIPNEEMREWLKTTVEDVLNLRPKYVYEVGCGTGMLLMKIAPCCEHYVGSDFAPAVLGRVREQLLQVPSLAKQVHLTERTAEDFDGLEQNSFDTVILNSVVQHFPTAAYLTGVLEKAARIIKDDGSIFIGDVLSLPLLPAFAASVASFQGPDEISLRELRDLIQRRIEMEQHLILSPAYFLWFQHQHSSISRVEIRPRRDRADNEMSRYRYHAILHIGGEPKRSFEFEFLDWNEHHWGLDEVRSLLRQHQGNGIGIKRIGNARIQKDLAILAKLRTADPRNGVGQLRAEADQIVEAGIHPQDLIDLGNDLGLQARLNWAACRADGSYDAVFLQNQSHSSAVAINWPEPDRSEYVQFANAPGENKFRCELLDGLVRHCKENLADEMLPGDITLVNTLANLVDGKVHGEVLLRARSAVLERLSATR